MLRVVFLILLFCLSLPAAARMYQWVDPETGTTQLSGKPPVWYRSGQGGPRVLVFADGRLIDDTGIKVSEGERQRLRQQALAMVERDRQQAKEKLRQAKRLKALADKEKEEEESEKMQRSEVTAGSGNETETGSEDETAEQEAEQTAEEMRNLIQEWEARRTRDARDVIQSDSAQDPTPPSAEAIPPPPPPD